MKAMARSVLRSCIDKLSESYKHSGIPRVLFQRVPASKPSSICKAYYDGDDSAPPPYPYIQQLSDDLILHIAEFLDVVPRACLKYTDSHFRKLINIPETPVLQCVRYRVLCYLEKDLLAQGAPLPNRLACAFCRCAHPRSDFGIHGENVGYGIEYLFMIEKSVPDARYCWRHIPKRLNYTSTDGDQSPSSEEKWVETKQYICWHCGNELSRDSDGKTICPICHEECPICGFDNIDGFQRYGPRRPLESYSKIRFTSRRCMRFALEIRDLNGICTPNTPLPTEPPLFWTGEPLLEYLNHIYISTYLIGRRARQFLLYSPVELMEPQPGNARVDICVIG